MGLILVGRWDGRGPGRLSYVSLTPRPALASVAALQNIVAPVSRTRDPRIEAGG